MLIVTLIIAGWGVLSLLATKAFLRVCRSGEYEDHNRHFGGERELVSVQAFSGPPDPASGV
ncbi:hypothetical protein ACI789_18440 [Geodermatophilus sp. SYSU D00965]